MMHQQTLPVKVMCWHTMCTDVSQIEECRNAQWNLGGINTILVL